MKWIQLIALFNFCDWVIALFIAGTMARVEGRDGRRTFLAVGLAVFFLGFALIRLGEFVNLIQYRDEIHTILGQVPPRYTVQQIVLGSMKTLALLCTWMAVTAERRERLGMLSGNIVRHAIVKLFEKLR